MLQMGRRVAVVHTQGAVDCVHCAVYTFIMWAMYNEQGALCTVCTVQCTVENVHCIL